MPWRLLPREDDFFGLFERHAALTVDGAQEMRRLVQGGENVHARAARIKELEHETDRITHACVERLHKTFITPFDRDDIHRLITRMDDVMDYIESAAGAVMLRTMGLRITKLRPVGGFCAETGGAVTLFLATHLGIPVSTTHTITGAIVGVGSVQNASAVRCGVAGRIVWAWVLTIPCSALIAALTWAVFR
jgi:hypothetical protein